MITGRELAQSVRTATDVGDAPRIAQIAPGEWTDAVREVMDIFERGPDNNIVRTFAQHPELAKHFLIFNRYLLRASTLPPRLRQIAILRVAWTRRVKYMWASHLRVSIPIGLTEADFEAVKLVAESPHWSALERRILIATDELLRDSQLTDESWAALSEQLDQRQRMDFLFTVGTYVLLALVFNTLRIEREPELQALARRFGSPAD
ncbi:MAG: carboxymuconolactone decarboxylase family protein [Gammaproteobacteria bacterium]